MFGFGRRYESIEGRVIASNVRKVHLSQGGARTTEWEYVVEYAVDGGEPQRVKLKQVWNRIGQGMKMINPPEGSKVPLLLNRKSGKVRFDADNPRINRNAIYRREQAEREARFNEALRR